ncbi:MAG: hypothetical protein IPL36_13365 [Nigerium sp.]|nr:hypothetical protein [Nigerium sp.]
MTGQFARVEPWLLDEAVAELLQPRLEEILKGREPGHCMRVTDLNERIMEALCARLHSTATHASVFILGGHEDEGKPFRVTSTKLVELRNPDAQGNLRPPLLVFVPTTLRTSAEDSFGVATFEDVSFPTVYHDLVTSLTGQVPATLKAAVESATRVLAEESWPFAHDVAIARFLLTALRNGIDGETLGASLYELGLIPDFRLLADPAAASIRVTKNLSCVRALMESPQSMRGRISDLGLSDETLTTRLSSFFGRFEIQEPESWTPIIATDRTWWPISFDKWQFKDQHTLGHVTFTAVSTDLPTIGPDETDQQLSTLGGQQVLTPMSRRQTNITFEVAQQPKRIAGLDHFTVQLLTQDGAPVGKAKKVKAWTHNRLQTTTALTKLDKLDFDEGWHVVRVVPRTADGDPLLVTLSDSAAHSNESEPFYVLPGGKIEEDPPQRAVPIDRSVEHARFRLQLTALSALIHRCRGGCGRGMGRGDRSEQGGW